MTTVSELFNSIKHRLCRVLSPGEADAATRIIFEDVAGYNRNYLWINGDRSVLDSTISKIEEAVAKVEQGTPVQYAVGKALFMGNYFVVNEATLIPRPETAGLVDIVIDTMGERSDLEVLDVGTGSGCIAIELAKALPFSKVTGWDVSSAALDIARMNADNLKVKLTFSEQNILSEKLPHKQWDVIVSNPPYICENEKDAMDKNVLEYEPHTALFVPDNDPLIFYRAIAKYAFEQLSPNGWLFFEINQRFSTQTVEMLQGLNFTDIERLRDYKSNWRYVKAKKTTDGI